MFGDGLFLTVVGPVVGDHCGRRRAGRGLLLLLPHHPLVLRIGEPLSLYAHFLLTNKCFLEMLLMEKHIVAVGVLSSLGPLHLVFILRDSRPGRGSYDA